MFRRILRFLFFIICTFYIKSVIEIFIVSGLFLAWTAITGHNYFHMRDNFRMYYFDLCTMSSKDWRISHAMSHHIYPNTVWDYEIYTVEPFIHFLPSKKKSWLRGFISQLLSPLYWSLAVFDQAIKRFVIIFPPLYKLYSIMALFMLN